MLCADSCLRDAALFSFICFGFYLVLQYFEQFIASLSLSLLQPDILEVESHFLFCCPAYDDARRKYLSHIIFPDTVRSLNSVFDNAGTEQLRKFAMFVFYALKHRE